jgi:hypothetical protein
VPLTIHRRRREPVEETVRALCIAAGVPLGRDAYRRLRRWIADAQAIDARVRTHRA